MNAASRKEDPIAWTVLMLESVGVEEAWRRGEDSHGRWAARKGRRWPRQGRGWTPQIGADSDDLLATTGVE
jgi:hypothetical protein